MGPFNGAKLVARAWADPGLQGAAGRRHDGRGRAARISDRAGRRRGRAYARGREHAEVHNLIICTLCSCYPWPVLGLPPYWYKDPSFRARAAREPRSGAQGVRPRHRPVEGDPDLGQQRADPLVRGARAACRDRGPERGELAALLTPEAMMGVALAKSPKAA